jgi:hypothetical protein
MQTLEWGTAVVGDLLKKLTGLDVVEKIMKVQGYWKRELC